MNSEKAFTKWAKQRNHRKSRRATKRRLQSAHIKHTVFCPKANKPKHLYKSEAAAKKALEYVDETFRENQKIRPRGYYYCPHCGGWHLTHHKTTKTTLTQAERRIFGENWQSD